MYNLFRRVRTANEDIAQDDLRALRKFIIDRCKGTCISYHETVDYKRYEKCGWTIAQIALDVNDMITASLIFRTRKEHGQNIIQVRQVNGAWLDVSDDREGFISEIFAKE